ncbi:MAG TPA: hypothetical protein VGN83_18400 [Falsiroseomonas sp.]|jgi:hypothetical protein|nr:hypothetical protein [Falsiroseomonas sp.]
MQNDITGRDWLIIVKALATTYALIGTLPEHCQQVSDRHDTGRLLHAMLGERWEVDGNEMRHVLTQAEWNQGWKWPPTPDLLITEFEDD